MATDQLDYRVASLEEIRQYHEIRIGLLEALVQRSYDLLEEVKRDSAQTQRLWVRLARRYGWLDDEGLG